MLVLFILLRGLILPFDFRNLQTKEVIARFLLTSGHKLKAQLT
jgi:hypothetical protein